MDDAVLIAISSAVSGIVVFLTQRPRIRSDAIASFEATVASLLTQVAFLSEAQSKSRDTISGLTERMGLLGVKIEQWRFRYNRSQAESKGLRSLVERQALVIDHLPGRVDELLGALRDAGIPVPSNPAATAALAALEGGHVSAPPPTGGPVNIGDTVVIGAVEGEKQ